LPITLEIMPWLLCHWVPSATSYPVYVTTRPRLGEMNLGLVGHLWALSDPLACYNFGCRKPYECTCTICCKQPPSLKSAASEVVFRFLHNLDTFCLEDGMTYDQYVFATRYGLNLPIKWLVPFKQFPDMLSFPYILFDDILLGQFHERCISAFEVQGNCRWTN